MNTAYDFMREYIPVHNAVKVREDGEFLIASNTNSDIYYLNGTAREMWNILDGNITVEGLCCKILGEYEVDRLTLEGDIVSFIRDFAVEEINTSQERKRIIMREYTAPSVTGGENSGRIIPAAIAAVMGLSIAKAFAAGLAATALRGIDSTADSQLALEPCLD